MKNIYFFFVCFAAVTLSLSHGDKEPKEDVEKNIKREQKLIFGHFSTRTRVSLSTIISTVPLTCVLPNFINAVACKRRQRRKRKFRQVKYMDQEDDTDLSLQPSQLEKDDSVGSDDRSAHKRGFLKITFWSSVTSFFTLTSTSTNTATTFSVSFYCSVAGFPFPPVCGR